jgi:hypothetical protein
MGHPKELTDNSGMVEGFQELEQMTSEGITQNEY